MRIQSVSQSPGTGQSQAQAAATAGKASAQDRDDAHDDLVDLHQASEGELAAALSQETLLALMQGILEALTGQPLQLHDPQHITGSLYDDAKAPAWLAAARHALVHPSSRVLHLTVIGRMSMVDGESQPFVLDMQLPKAPSALGGGALSGSFTLSRHAGACQGARVDYSSLTTLSELHAADRCNPPWTALPAPAVAALSGTPVFAQFSLGSDPDILSMAARILPSGRDHALPTYAHGLRDGGYVDTGEPCGSLHQVDISA
ncbi:hypothetical protein [Paludibacterium purpuratum]|uniref:Uncharacterized protein n=1 Tax=Paludibacterium purpuratum TaxID=1144873 RepID=A0A4R7BCS4_9NEIS|nr:hypothetical protein [Paludibacterium purpuratum]TDR81962.1 hypothetical protein DFP86_10272 [Paludibacterium purpuratum]